MNTFFEQRNALRMGKVLLVLAVFTMLFMAMRFINETNRVGAFEGDLSKMATIDVQGEGIAFAIPDIAAVSFTVQKKAATVHDAQEAVTAKTNAAVEFLKKSGVAEKDIQTTNYNAYPEYDYCSGANCTNRTEPKLLGYDVSQTISVKVRDTANVGKVIDGLGAIGVTGLSGPQFTVDNADAINAQARTKAIADAKQKAAVLSRQLGVNLVKIVRFSENGGGGYPVPMYASKDMAAGMGGAERATSAIPAGENKYVSNVVITYAIE